MSFGLQAYIFKFKSKLQSVSLLGLNLTMVRELRKGHKKTLVKTRVFKWCPDADSNHGHKDFKSFALPTEL